jgi:pullulanase/glycogen debranching enzyme
LIKAVNESGLRVIMNVVYDHADSSGRDEKSARGKVMG